LERFCNLHRGQPWQNPLMHNARPKPVRAVFTLPKK
jgi:hypothetical protein